MCWSTLPPELRCIVFNHLESDKCRQYNSPSGHQAARKKRTGSRRGEQANYAAVNREWQANFEEKNFRRLIIHQSDIPGVDENIVQPGRGGLVRCIWLRFELPKYCCDRCSKPESMFEKWEHEATLTEAVRDLLGHISTFSGDHPGIILELSVHSPSDSQHWFRSLKGNVNDTMWYSSDSQPVERSRTDKTHDYKHAMTRRVHSGPYLRVFGNAHGLMIDPKRAGIAPRKTLPRAKVVKELIIRLQFQRHLSIKKALLPITRSLPELESITYECRRGPEAGSTGNFRSVRDAEHCELFSRVVAGCKTLRNVSVHEANNYAFYKVGSPWTPAIDIGRSLGEHSGHLREIHVGGMVEARDFFHQFFPDATGTQVTKGKGKRKTRRNTKRKKTRWPNLEYLSLSTNLLGTTSREALLQAAAAAADRMPKLRTMELSGPEKHEMFIYLAKGSQRTILVPSRMASGLTSDTIHCWQRLAARDENADDLRIEVPLFGAGDEWCRRYPGAISRRSATNTTLKQLEVENQTLARGSYFR